MHGLLQAHACWHLLFVANSDAHSSACAGPHLLFCNMQLADTKCGVIGLQWRPVACDYKPDNPAPAPAHPTPGQQPPKGTQYPPAGYWDEPRSQWPGSSGSLESAEDTSVRLPG